ncbi:MAG: hypothetical protein AAF443_04925 [Chlamydiota bacterium]
MFGQTFSLVDIPRLFTLIFLEGILSVDNALALAVIARSLPVYQRRKALFVGMFSALVFRAMMILTAAYLIRFFWLQLLGGGYLIYLGMHHFFLAKKKKKPLYRSIKPRGFLHTVVLIEGADLVFAIDSILAALALVGMTFHPPELPPKLWIVYLGGIIGLAGMRFAAHFFTTLLEKFSRLEKSVHLIIGWIGFKLIIESIAATFFATTFPFWADALFWAVIFVCFCVGFLPLRSRTN